MAISSDIQRAIEIIDQRIQSLQRIKEMLVKEFGGEGAALSGQVSLFEPSISTTPFKKTRKQFLVDFFREHGAQTRQAIREKTALPLGTVAFLLNDKDTFQRLPDGKWTIKQK
jgi:hypothetical protein